MPYDWAGQKILQQNTTIPSKRRVIGHEDTLVPTDLREWVTGGDHEEIRRVVETLQLPEGKSPGSFDQRALIAWEYVVTKVKYVGDAESHRQLDFWQFPAETIALGQGDCEDSSFLLATLMLASGISSFCIRVVFGTIKLSDTEETEGHVWPIYKDETGVWRILESTYSNWPATWLEADKVARPGLRPRYKPDICLNGDHVWQVGRGEIANVAAYIAGHQRKRLAQKHRRCLNQRSRQTGVGN